MHWWGDAVCSSGRVGRWDFILLHYCGPHKHMGWWCTGSPGDTSGVHDSELLPLQAVFQVALTGYIKKSAPNRRLQHPGPILISELGCMFFLVDQCQSSNCSCPASGPFCGLACRLWILWCPPLWQSYMHSSMCEFSIRKSCPIGTHLRFP